MLRHEYDERQLEVMEITTAYRQAITAQERAQLTRVMLAGVVSFSFAAGIFMPSGMHPMLTAIPTAASMTYMLAFDTVPELVIPEQPLRESGDIAANAEPVHITANTSPLNIRLLGHEVKRVTVTGLLAYANKGHDVFVNHDGYYVYVDIEGKRTPTKRGLSWGFESSALIRDMQAYGWWVEGGNNRKRLTRAGIEAINDTVKRTTPPPQNEAGE